MPLDALTTVLVLALLFALWGWWRASTRVARGNRTRQVRASAGEHQAEALLARYGYTVDERQVTVRWTMHVDGEQVVASRADLLVSQWRRRYVAEVKTGDLAPDPTRPATRRQLMVTLHPPDGPRAMTTRRSTRRGRVVGDGETSAPRSLARPAAAWAQA